MPFDNTPQPTKPSLAELARVLRHPEEWPEGFKWNYWNPHTCGIGLAERIWGFWPAQHLIAPVVGERIFFHCDARLPFVWWKPFAYRQSMAPTPEHVASAIDRYLARR